MEENIDQSRWLIGSSEMAERIHAHDWAATPLGPVTGWSSRLKLMVEQVLANPLVSSLVCGPENLLIYNDAAARLYGSRHPAALGQPLPQIFPEGWVTVAKFYERVFAGESVQVIAQPLDTRGEATLATDIFDAVLTPVREDDGRVAYVHMVGSRVRAEVMLRESEERFRALTQGLPQLVWAADEGGLWTWASDQWANYTGQSQADNHQLGWLDALHPEDRARALQGWKEAHRTRRLDVEYRVRRALDGSYRWHQTRALPLKTGSGFGHRESRVLEWLGTSIDVEDLKQLQAQQAMLLGELEHRSRNLLALVRSISERSFEQSSGCNEFEVRLAVISRVQCFLSQGLGRPLQLSELLQAELRMHVLIPAKNITVRGPQVELPNDKASSIALAIHELMTNAVKHGALSQKDGRLTITWWVEQTENEPECLHLDWVEIGVTMADTGALKRNGFGRELIEHALSYQLQARTRLEFASNGVRCRIVIPLIPVSLSRRNQ